MLKNVLIITIIGFLQMAGCGNHHMNTGEPREHGVGLDREILARILAAEDQRDEKLLLEIWETQPMTPLLAQRLAHAAGRIPAFSVWEKLAEGFADHPAVTESLATAARYPGTDFDPELVLAWFKRFKPGAAITESALHLNTAAGTSFALTLKKYSRIAANNLWRAKDHANTDLMRRFYAADPGSAIYSAYRSRTAGIVKAQDLSGLELTERFYGTLVCDHPETMLAAPEWQVRIAALRGTKSVTAARRALADSNPLVRAAALGVFLSEGGDFSSLGKLNLSAMEIEIAASIIEDPEQLQRWFDSGSLVRSLVTPYMPASARRVILASDCAVRYKLRFLENRFNRKAAIGFAYREFNVHDSGEALEYLLNQDEAVDKKKLVETAREKGGFTSLLIEYGHIEKPRIRRPHSFYVNVLDVLDRYHGFDIVTEKGIIRCRFFPRQAPLTCFNMITLIEKRFFNGTRFHRVIPAFVAQDGDPTGSGSGGPGYAIRCEYNSLRYDEPGMVGMALAGKDTGGSQYFLTHLATPHLNHQYTIYAKVTDGLAVLAHLLQYDRIITIRLF